MKIQCAGKRDHTTERQKREFITPSPLASKASPRKTDHTVSPHSNHDAVLLYLLFGDSYLLSDLRLPATLTLSIMLEPSVVF